MLCLLAQVAGRGEISFLTCNDFLLERQWTARDRSWGGVDLWASRVEVSFSVTRKSFVFYVYVIQE